jgi:hypothetical protein
VSQHLVCKLSAADLQQLQLQQLQHLLQESHPGGGNMNCELLPFPTLAVLTTMTTLLPFLSTINYELQTIAISNRDGTHAISAISAT